MSALTLSERRKRLKFRAGHRGMRELDILMGGFAQAHADALDESELAEFERLLDVPDQAMLTWLFGQGTPDPQYDTPMFRRLQCFCNEMAR